MTDIHGQTKLRLTREDVLFPRSADPARATSQGGDTGSNPVGAARVAPAQLGYPVPSVSDSGGFRPSFVRLRATTFVDSASSPSAGGFGQFSHNVGAPVVEEGWSSGGPADNPQKGTNRGPLRMAGPHLRMSLGQRCRIGSPAGWLERPRREAHEQRRSRRDSAHGRR